MEHALHQESCQHQETCGKGMVQKLPGSSKSFVVFVLLQAGEMTAGLLLQMNQLEGQPSGDLALAEMYLYPMTDTEAHLQQRTYHIEKKKKKKVRWKWEDKEDAPERDSMLQIHHTPAKEFQLPKSFEKSRSGKDAVRLHSM